MEKQAQVVFRNVGQLYFPETRVECHYSLTPDHQWSRKDWIGIFEVGRTSLKEYYTYTWALVPEGYAEGTNTNCCAHFHAFYLPRPSAVEYQFVYVDESGEVCARSRHFTFCAPKPLDELETMREERGEEEGEGEEGEEELLLVVPKAQLLQGQLEESRKERADLKTALEAAQREKEVETAEHAEERREWEREREAMREEVSELRGNLAQSWERLKSMEGKDKTREGLASEINKLSSENADSQQQVKGLEEDVKVLTDRDNETNAALERMKERMTKMSNQMKYEEEKRKLMQEENEGAAAEVRGLQQRLEASERVAESLRKELSDLGSHQSSTHAELHHARLQVAQLTLQLSSESLVLKEGRACWAQDREAYKHSAEIVNKKLQEVTCEVQQREEWLREERVEREKLEVELERERDCGRVQLGDARRESQELRAGLRSAQRERDQQQQENQDLLDYVHQLERRLGTVADSNSLVFRPHSEASLGLHEEQSSESGSSEDKQLILPKLINPILSELADAPLW